MDQIDFILTVVSSVGILLIIAVVLDVFFGDG